MFSHSMGSSLLLATAVRSSHSVGGHPNWSRDKKDSSKLDSMGLQRKKIVAEISSAERR
jgi:hypothetical protein